MTRDRFIAWLCPYLTGLLLATFIAILLQAQAAKPTPQTMRKKPAPATKPVSPNVVPALEPKAIDLLKEMSSRLEAARTMSLTATVIYESPSRLGPPLAYMTISDVTL